MVGPRNQQLIESIFLQASEIDDLERRREFLAQACSGNEELLNLLEKMLRAEGSTRAGQLDKLAERICELPVDDLVRGQTTFGVAPSTSLQAVA